jgi:hypothetical protein
MKLSRELTVDTHGIGLAFWMAGVFWNTCFNSFNSQAINLKSKHAGIQAGSRYLDKAKLEIYE